MGTKDSPFVLTLALAKFPLKPLGVLTPHLNRNDGVTRPPLTREEFFGPFVCSKVEITISVWHSVAKFETGSFWFNLSGLRKVETPERRERHKTTPLIAATM